jgi:hypothetical protein
MLSHTSTEWAPWYVIPADRKWFMRLAVGFVIANTLLEIDPRYPRVSRQQREALLEVKQALEAQAPEGAAADPFAESRHDADVKHDADGKNDADAESQHDADGQHDAESQHDGNVPADAAP